MHHEIVFRRAQVTLACQCPCHEADYAVHEGCPGDIAVGALVIDHIDNHGHTSSRCEVCGTKPD